MHPAEFRGHRTGELLERACKSALIGKTADERDFGERFFAGKQVRSKFDAAVFEILAGRAAEEFAKCPGHRKSSVFCSNFGLK